MAKRPQMTKKQQEYRDNLAYDIKKLREHGDTGRQLAENLLESKKDSNRYNIPRFQWEKISEKDIDFMLKHGYIKSLLKNLDKIENFSHQKIADLLIKRGEGKLVLMYLDKFKGLDHNDIVDKLLERKQGNVVEYYLDNFNGLNKNTITKLVEKLDGGERALLYLDKWIGSEHINYETVEHLFSYNIFYGYHAEDTLNILLEKLDKIDGLDIEAVNHLLGKVYLINEELWNRRHGRSINGYKIKMDMFDDIETFADTIKAKHYPRKIFKGIIDNFDNFDNSSRIQFARILYKNGFLLKYLNQFKDGEHKQIALDLIKDGGSNFVVKHINEFKGIDKEVAEMLVEAGYGNVVAKYPEKFGLKKGK